MEKAEVGDIIERLRADRRRVRGDGFGPAGDLISAYKRSIASLERLQLALDYKPGEPEPDIEWLPNPNCCGRAGDSIPGCECRLVFENLTARNSMQSACLISAKLGVQVPPGGPNL